jgi:hypothetical protein
MTLMQATCSRCSIKQALTVVTAAAGTTSAAASNTIIPYSLLQAVQSIPTSTHFVHKPVILGPCNLHQPLVGSIPVDKHQISTAA